MTSANQNDVFFFAFRLSFDWRIIEGELDDNQRIKMIIRDFTWAD